MRPSRKAGTDPKGSTGEFGGKGVAPVPTMVKGSHWRQEKRRRRRGGGDRARAPKRARHPEAAKDKAASGRKDKDRDKAAP